MNIQRAIKEAIEVGGFIARASWGGHILVKPTNTPCCCWIQAKNEAPCPRWEPKAEDLMADDWDVVSA